MRRIAKNASLKTQLLACHLFPIFFCKSALGVWKQKVRKRRKYTKLVTGENFIKFFLL
jgi:hypothetical protein